MKKINHVIEHPIFKRSASVIIGTLSLIWLVSDKSLPMPYRVVTVASLAGIGLINKKELEQEQSDKFIEIKKQNKADLLDQAVISVPDKSEEIEYPTVFATEFEDTTGMAMAIQTILDTNKIRTTFRGFVDAPRFQRYLLSQNLQSVNTASDRMGEIIHRGLPNFNIQLKNTPIVGIEQGLLAVDIPKSVFNPITYSKSSNLIINARNNNQRIIGINYNGELITEEISQFNAFCMIGGMTRSGKSVFMRQDCLEFMLRNSNDRFYLIERKEGTFSIFEGCNQVVDKIAYDISGAAVLINKLHQVLLERIKTARQLIGSEKQKYYQWCFENMHHLYFDEYADDDTYTNILADEIFKKGAQYGIRGTLGTQQHNRTDKNDGGTVSGVLLEQSSTRICFKVRTPIASNQIIQDTRGVNLLGFGDCLYSSATEFELQRLQTVFYTDEELSDLCAKLEYGKVIDNPTSINKTNFILEVPLYQDLTSQFIKPVTKEWEILQLIRDSKSKKSVTTIAREVGLSRETERVQQAVELFYDNKLIHKEKASNGRGFVYYR